VEAVTLSAPYLPVKVSAVELAFPAHALDLMPAWEDIPDEFTCGDINVWSTIASSWFVHGLPDTVEFHLIDGIDGETMVRHLRCILGSYAPKHKHKMAAVAYLLSLWCERVDYWQIKERA
jgi:hypothetical protein